MLSFSHVGHVAHLAIHVTDNEGPIKKSLRCMQDALFCLVCLAILQLLICRDQPVKLQHCMPPATSPKHKTLSGILLHALPCCAFPCHDHLDVVLCSDLHLHLAGKWFDLLIEDITQSPARASQHNNTISYVSQYIPLWVGIADEGSAQAQAVTRSFFDSRLIQPGGISTSTYNSTQQWDFPNCWAPLQVTVKREHLCHSCAAFSFLIVVLL